MWWSKRFWKKNCSASAVWLYLYATCIHSLCTKLQTFWAFLAGLNIFILEFTTSPIMLSLVLWSSYPSLLPPTGITIASALVDTSQQRAGDFKDKGSGLKSRKQQHTMHQGTCVWTGPPKSPERPGDFSHSPLHFLSFSDNGRRWCRSSWSGNHSGGLRHE